MPGVYGGDEINAVVLDPGASIIRGGWAGEDNPRTVIPSHYGWLPLGDNESDDVPRGVSLDKTRGRKRFLGDAGVTYWRQGLEIDSPFDDMGIISDLSLIHI